MVAIASIPDRKTDAGEVDYDLARAGIFAADRDMVFGGSDEDSFDRVASIIVGGNGYWLPFEFSVLGRNGAGLRR